jgi:hypothetical protein
MRQNSIPVSSVAFEGRCATSPVSAVVSRIEAGQGDGLPPADGDLLVEWDPARKNIGIFRVRKVELQARATNNFKHLHDCSKEPEASVDARLT